MIYFTFLATVLRENLMFFPWVLPLVNQVVLFVKKINLLLLHMAANVATKELTFFEIKEWVKKIHTSVRGSQHFLNVSLQTSAKGEWRGLMVSVEDCHYKSREIKSRSLHFFFNTIAFCLRHKVRHNVRPWGRSAVKHRKARAAKWRGGTGRRFRNGYEKGLVRFIWIWLNG